MRTFSLSIALAIASFAYALTPPCQLLTNNQESFESQWVTVDSNGDGDPYIFQFLEDAAYYTENRGKSANDWVISPAVTLTAGVTYNITATVQNISTYSTDKDKFKICVGTAQTVDGMTSTVFKEENLTRSSTPEEKKGTFTPSVSGDYYFGINLYSSSYMGDFKFYGFSIEALASIPAAVTGLKGTPAPEGAMQATLTWTWPSANTLGGTLSSITGAYIYRGTSASFTVGENTLIGSYNENATPGTEGTFTDTSVPSSNSYYYKVVPFNENGISTSTPASCGPIWIGADTSLKAVTELTATVDAAGTSVWLTWVAPEGSNGGYVDLANVAYKISRSKDGASPQVIAEEWKGELPFVDTGLYDLGSYTYTVNTIYNGASGFSSATSNAVIAGGSMPLPYTNTFDTQSSINLFTMFTGTGVTREWTYSSLYKNIQYWGGTTADAWAALPVFELEAGTTYRFSFTTYVARSASPKNLAIAIGNAPTAEALTETLFSEKISNIYSNEREFTFSVPADGKYYLALHCYGESDSNSLYVDDINLTAIETTPLPATDVTSEAAPAGALKAIVKWTNPSKDSAGNELQSISKAVVTIDGEDVAEVADATPGAESSVEIPVAAPGFYTYSVTIYSGESTSPSAETTTPWIGFDTPLPPASVSVSEAEGQRTVEFEPVTQGVNNGYIDTAELRYIISRNDDVLTTDHKGSPYIDMEGDLPLAVYTYSVKAINGSLVGEAASAAPITLGEALELPYNPDFADADEMALWTLTNGWKYNASAKTINTSTSDSWAFTPPIIMKQGTCEVNFRATCFNYRYQEDMKVYLVESTILPISADALLVGSHHIESVSFPDPITDTFTVEKTGKYYLAFGLDEANWTLTITQADVKQLTEDETPNGVDDNFAETALTFDSVYGKIIAGCQGRLRVVNMQGVTVMEANVDTEAVSTDALAAGAYIASLIDTEGHQFTIKFIK